MRKLIWSLAVMGACLRADAKDKVQTERPDYEAVRNQLPPAPRCEAPPPSPYEVKAKDGPWMICAATYSGANASHLADQVVRHLRGKKVNAFVFNYADRERRRLEKEYNERVTEQMRNHPDAERHKLRYTRVEAQVAVLVGGFKTMDAASSALPKIKDLPAPKITYPDGEDAAMVFVKYGEGEVGGNKREKTKALGTSVVNPFARSFVIRNPAASHETAKKDEVDPKWKPLNAHEPYSLLKNKKNFTLVVKVYLAPAVHQASLSTGEDDGILGKLGFGNRKGDPLQATALQAHELAKLLRHFKLDAYVMHMRHGSLVAVGGYDELDDAEMRQMRRKLAGYKLQISGAPVMTGKNVDPTLDPWQLLPDPMPMRVPRL